VQRRIAIRGRQQDRWFMSLVFAVLFLFLVTAASIGDSLPRYALLWELPVLCLACLTIAAMNKAGRIPADPSKQAPNNSYAPPLFYEDVEFTCIDCGRVEFWTAKQQQWW
jgi:hypothetical protein